MSEVEIDVVKVHHKPKGNVTVTIPMWVVRKMGLTEVFKMKVYYDEVKRRVIFEVM